MHEKIVLKRVRNVNLIIHSLVDSFLLIYSYIKIHHLIYNRKKYCKSNNTREILKGCAPLLLYDRDN